MRARRRQTRTIPAPAWLSVPAVVLGVLCFLAAGITAGALSRSVAISYIAIEGFDARAKAPVPLVCGREEARSLDGKSVFSPKGEALALAAGRWSGTPYTDFLTEMSKGGKLYVLFLVRPEGVESFEVFRQIVLRRNAELCSASVTLPRTPQRDSLRGLSPEVRPKVQLAGDQLFFGGPMSQDELSALGGVLGDGTRNALEVLFQKSRQKAACIDHGVELLPAEWTFITDADGRVRFGPPGR